MVRQLESEQEWCDRAVVNTIAVAEQDEEGEAALEELRVVTGRNRRLFYLPNYRIIESLSSVTSDKSGFIARVGEKVADNQRHAQVAAPAGWHRATVMVELETIATGHSWLSVL